MLAFRRPADRTLRAARTASRLAVGGALLCSAWAGYGGLAPGATSLDGAVAVATLLPDEFRSIRPADLDATPPPIAPAELWPAQ